MTAAVEFNISDLVRNPTSVIEQAERGEVILHRRGREDLRLTLASRTCHSPALNEALARIVAGLLREETGRAAIREVMSGLYPWLRFLPDDIAERCVRELLDTAVSCASVDNFAAFDTEVAAWRSTAEAYSDPALFAKLSGPAEIEDLGPVPRPQLP